MNIDDVFRLSLAGELAEGKIIFAAPVRLETFFSCRCAISNRLLLLQQHDPSVFIHRSQLLFFGAMHIGWTASVIMI